MSNWLKAWWISFSNTVKAENGVNLLPLTMWGPILWLTARLTVEICRWKKPEICWFWLPLSLIKKEMRIMQLNIGICWLLGLISYWKKDWILKISFVRTTLPDILLIMPIFRSKRLWELPDTVKWPECWVKRISLRNILRQPKRWPANG